MTNDMTNRIPAPLPNEELQIRPSTPHDPSLRWPDGVREESCIVYMTMPYRWKSMSHLAATAESLLVGRINDVVQSPPDWKCVGPEF
jgi:hypothetical protein